MILAGGFGTRLSEETGTRPKPMVEIGGRPILWHIMKIFGHYGFNEFVLALGYKADMVKEYFLNFNRYSGDLSLKLCQEDPIINRDFCTDWKVHLKDTGYNSGTGGRF